MCNWENRAKDSTAPWRAVLRPLLESASEGPACHSAVHVLEFWSSEYSSPTVEVHTEHLDFFHRGQGVLRAHGVRPHCAKLLAIRPLLADRPQYVGSDIHFSCGLEVTKFEWTETPGGAVSINLDIDAGKVIKGPYHVWLSLPGEPTEIVGGTGAVRVHSHQGGTVWRLSLPTMHGVRYVSLHLSCVKS
jgi:hypothetical protein